MTLPQHKGLFQGITWQGVISTLQPTKSKGLCFVHKNCKGSRNGECSQTKVHPCGKGWPQMTASYPQPAWKVWGTNACLPLSPPTSGDIGWTRNALKTWGKSTRGLHWLLGTTVDTQSSCSSFSSFLEYGPLVTHAFPSLLITSRCERLVWSKRGGDGRGEIQSLSPRSENMLWISSFASQRSLGAIYSFFHWS